MQVSIEYVGLISIIGRCHSFFKKWLTGKC